MARARACSRISANFRGLVVAWWNRRGYCGALWELGESEGEQCNAACRSASNPSLEPKLEGAAGVVARQRVALASTRSERNRTVFTGEHERLLDDKGRLVLPPLFRRYVVETCFLTRSGSDPCLLLFTPEEIQEAADRLKALVRAGEVSPNEQRRWAASITEVKTDSQGRIAIPPKLREQVGLDREVVVIGVVDRAEIWNASAWAAVESASDEGISEGLWL